MPQRRERSPYWDGKKYGAISSPGDEESSDFSRAIKGLMGRIVNPNQRDPSNPVVNGASQSRSWIRDLLADVATQVPRTGANLDILSSIAETKIFNGGILDDRDYLTEKIVRLTADLPMNSAAQEELASNFVKTLWSNLEHPPVSLLGPTYRYRTADGSNNNTMYPQLGKAGSSYARVVSPQTAQPGIKPDPDVIFDALFARGSEVKEHPNKISSMLFYLAIIINHDIFLTDMQETSKLRTSSYLDLAPLYGSSEDELSSVRTFSDGLLKPDTFAQSHMLTFPPGVSALLVCFNRYHNFTAINLKTINENGRFDVPEDKNDTDVMRKLDNDLFQTARLITGGLYINIILHDFLRTILNLHRTESPWTLDPRDNLNNYFDVDGVPSGIGNQVSVEFNLAHRWYAGISKRDEHWLEDFHSVLFPKQSVSSLSPSQYQRGVNDWTAKQGKDPSRWTLGHGKYRRNQNGTFKDKDLSGLLTAATEDVACALGARQVPVVMRAIEVIGIRQARRWNVATLNEFRIFFQLQPYKFFHEITSDTEIAHALQALYKYPDYVELYPGLIAEATKSPGVTGSGLCLGFTASRAILSNIVALVRGDRHYTIDYSPANLTNWGWQTIQSDEDVASGHCIYSLIMRALPNWYRGNSIYAMFPFIHPDENRVILKDVKRDHQYGFERPSLTPVPPAVNTWNDVNSVLLNPTEFRVPWGDHIADLIGSKYQYMLGRDDDVGKEQRADVSDALYCPVNSKEQIREFYEALTTQLVEIRSERLRSEIYQLDACRDVANPSHAIFVARMWQIPLRGHRDQSLGIEVEKLYLAFAAMFAYVFLDADTAQSFKLRHGAKDACDQLRGLVKVVVTAIKAGDRLHFSELFEMGHAGRLLSQYGERLLTRLFKEGKSVDEVVAIVLPTAVAAVATQAQNCTEMLNLYLSDKYKHHWHDIRKCAWSDDPEDFEKLKRYALEANRLAPAAYGVVREAADDCILKAGGKTIKLKKKDKIYLDFIAAGRDPEKFPNPEQIDINRKDPPYIQQGTGSHGCLGKEMVEIAMAAQLKVFAKLKNLRRAPGPQGQMKSAVLAPNPVSSDPKPPPGAIKAFMLEDWSNFWPFPTTLKVHHEGFFHDQDEYLIKDTGLPHRGTDIEEARSLNSLTSNPISSPELNGHDSDRAESDTETEEVSE